MSRLVLEQMSTQAIRLAVAIFQCLEPVRPLPLREYLCRMQQVPCM